MILALDCATKTGWCLMQDGRIIESGTMDFSKQRGESNGILFLHFRTWLNNMLGSGQLIDLVVYELAHHRGGAATEVCVNLTGRVQEICGERKIEYVTVHTGTLKKFATGSGAAKKDNMIMAAERIAGRQVKDDNEADAILLAQYAFKNYG